MEAKRAELEALASAGKRLHGMRDGRMYYRIPTLPFYNWYLLLKKKKRPIRLRLETLP